MRRLIQLALVVAALAVCSSASAQQQFILQTASGALTATTTTAAPNAVFSTAIIFLDVTTITTPDADDTVDFYIQTTYDDGTTWTDVENVHFATADDGNTATRIIVIDGAKDGPGTLQSLAGSNPAAGVEISEAVPVDTFWSVRSISAALVTDSNAASRRVRATLDDGTTVYHRVSAGVDQTLTLTVQYSWSPVGAPAVGVVAATDATVNVPLPMPTILGPGYKFVTVTGAILAGDNWGAPQLVVEAWHDARVSTDAAIGDNLRSYNRPLGSQIRIFTAVAGATAPTYAFSARGVFR